MIKTKSKIFNIGAGKPQSINYLINLLVGKKYEIIKIPNRPGEPNITEADISRSRRELKWKPTKSFKWGILEMMKNIDYWKHSKLWNKKNIAKATVSWFKYLKN